MECVTRQHLSTVTTYEHLEYAASLCYLEFNKQPQFKASNSTVPFIYLTLTTGTVYGNILQTPATLFTALSVCQSRHQSVTC
jgi:hypothetical protein